MDQLRAEAKRQKHRGAEYGCHLDDDPAQILEVIQERLDRLALLALTKLKNSRNFHGMSLLAESRASKARVFASCITLSAIMELNSFKLNSRHSTIDSLASGFLPNPVGRTGWAKNRWDVSSL